MSLSPAPSDKGSATPPPPAPDAPALSTDAEAAEVAGEGGQPEAPAEGAVALPTQTLPAAAAKPAPAEAASEEPGKASMTAVAEAKKYGGVPAVPEAVRRKAAAVRETGRLIPTEKLLWDTAQVHGQIRPLTDAGVLAVMASLRTVPLLSPASVTVVPADAAGVSVYRKSAPPVQPCQVRACRMALRAYARSSC